MTKEKYFSGCVRIVEGVPYMVTFQEEDSHFLCFLPPRLSLLPYFYILRHEIIRKF